MWQLQNSSTVVEDFELNNSTIEVTIAEDPVRASTYKITSTATNNASGKTTIIESYVSNLDLSPLLDGAITSLNRIVIKNTATVTGDVYIQDEDNLDNKGTINPPDPLVGPIENWPTAEQLSEYFLEQVGDPVGGHWIDTSGYTEENPYPVDSLHVAGDLTIHGSGVARLGGIVYVEGHVEVKQGSTLMLNGQTIFAYAPDPEAQGSMDFKEGCNILGSGCIIAEGQIQFRANASSNPEDFVFIMSIDDEAIIDHGGILYGSVAGDVTVELKAGCELTWVEPDGGDGLDFPAGALKVHTYTIE